ncbi:LOW QUALITY PROTEIN: hypothetical protein ACHAWF_011401 [Thalassiosira exigua]
MTASRGCPRTPSVQWTCGGLPSGRKPQRGGRVDRPGAADRCPLRFSSQTYDTEQQQRVGVDRVIRLTDGTSLAPCTILGAVSPSISIPTSIVTGLRGVPQIIPISTSPTLDDTSQYKLFGWTIPNDDGTLVPLLSKVESWGVRYLAVLHVDDAYGNAFAKGISLGAQRQGAGLVVRTVDLAAGADADAISEAVRQLRETRYAYFFGIVHPEEGLLDKVMTEAYRQGTAGTRRHAWLFSDAVGESFTSRDFSMSSSLERVYCGIGVLSAVGGVPGMAEFDELASQLRRLKESPEDLAFLEDHLPRDYEGGVVPDHAVVTGSEGYLSAPRLVVPFLYDAVVALGLAACKLAEDSEEGTYFDGDELFGVFKNVTFDGASGRIVLDLATGTRDPRSAFFSLTNFVEDADAGPGNVWFKGMGTDLFQGGKWESLVPCSDTWSTLPWSPSRTRWDAPV